LWEEELKRGPGNTVIGGPIHAATGKCWGRRDWQQGWILEGPAELFTQNNVRIIRAEFASGQLHGSFCSWFTNGEVRETGQYLRGLKHGVWKRFDRTWGLAREEYDRGKKVGLWDRPHFREHYRNDRLVKSETQRSIPDGDWEICEFDDDEKPKRVSHWNGDRTRDLGVEHYSAGKRHGKWQRVQFVGDRPVVRRGQWTEGLPDGEWLYEQLSGSPRKFEFQRGVLIKANGAPMHDWLMQRFVRHREVAEKLVDAVDTLKLTGTTLHSRRNLLQRIPLYNWAPLGVDPRLNLTQEKLDELLEENLPSGFVYQDLPETAAICLAFHEANLCFDYRLGAIWLTSPELAATWQDETGTREWFHEIASTESKYELDARGRRRLVEGPDYRLEHYFGEINECRMQWEETRVLKLASPLTCRLGTARQLDGRLPTDAASVKFAGIVEEDFLRDLRLDERLPIECELHHCRLALHGDTLVFERLPASPPR
jgi:hypothetical protein